MEQEQQRPVSPMMATFQAALENLIIDARNQATTRLLGILSGKHFEWHGEQSTKVSGDCHTCLLLGMVEKQPEKSPEESPVNT